MVFSRWLCEMAKLKLEVGTKGQLHRRELVNPIELFDGTFKKLD